MPKAILRPLDLAAAIVVALGGLAVLAVAAVLRRPRPTRGRKLLTLEADYSLSTIRRLGLEHVITSRDLCGFFDHVWTVHPAVGSSPEDDPASGFGPPSRTSLSPRHTMIEGKVALSRRLLQFPFLNFALAQCQLLLHLDRLIARERISVVRASDPFFLGPMGLVLARAHRIPLVVRLIANYDGNYYKGGRAAYPRLFRKRWVEKRIDRFVLPRADLVAAGNEDILGYALANGVHTDRSTTFLVGNLIDPVHFQLEPSKRTPVGPELGLDGRPFVITVGRLEPDKHPEDVLLALVTARAKVPDLAAVLVGDGTMREALQTLATAKGVDGSVIFVGTRDQGWVADALTSAAVVLSPVTGRALVEALLSGSPVVAYDVDWQAELVRSGETGVLVPYRDTGAMSEAVCRLIQDPEQAAALGARGRAKTLQVMDPDALMRHERAAYERLLGDG